MVTLVKEIGSDALFAFERVLQGEQLARVPSLPGAATATSRWRSRRPT